MTWTVLRCCAERRATSANVRTGGYVFKGKMTFRFGDRDETYEAGDAFYAPAGHTPITYEGAEVLMSRPHRS